MQSILDEKTGAATAEVQGGGGAAGQAEAQALFAAVNKGDLEQVKLLLPITPAPAVDAAAAADAASPAPPAVRLSVNLCDSAGFTPLLIASRLRHTELVRYLLTHPDIDVNAHTTNYNTAFLYACAKGSVKIVQMLLEAGADFFFTNANNDTCLMCAAIAGDAPTVQFLFDAFHSILKALQSRAFAPTSSGSHKRWVTMKNDEGLTSLMCATMSGSAEVVRMVLRESRAEVGVALPASFEPSALTHFFPSIWPEVLGSIQFEPASAAGYIDPSPPAFLAFVNAQNLMGDTALHIAAEQQAVDLFLLLVDNAGADPMKANRRGRRSFELLDTKAAQAAAEGAGTAAGAATAAAPSDASSAAAAASPSIQESLTQHLEKVINFQRDCRAQYLSAQAKNSEKLFSELMEEEEESQLAAHRRKKPSKAKVELVSEKKAGKKKKKGNAAAAAATAPKSTAAAKSDSEDSDASPSASPRLAPASSSAAPAAASASPSLFPAAAPYVPLAAQASVDAASGWEVVVPKTHAKVKSTGKPSQQQAAAPAAAAAVPHHRPAAEKKKPAAPVASVTATTAAPAATAAAAAAPGSPKTQPRKNKSFGGAGKKAEAPQNATATAAASASTATTTAAAPAPVATLAATPITSVPYTLVPVPTPIAAPTAASSASAHSSATDSTPSSSFFAAFSSRPRAWRPITALQRRSSAAGADASSSAAAPSTVVPPPSTSSPSSDSLQTLFTSLHPHIESTDLQLSHLLGADWHSLSMSQLSVLEEVYGQLARQIRDTQLSLFQQQQQETMSELVRTKSEVSALRKEVEALAGLRQQ